MEISFTLHFNWVNFFLSLIFGVVMKRLVNYVILKNAAQFKWWFFVWLDILGYRHQSSCAVLKSLTSFKWRSIICLIWYLKDTIYFMSLCRHFSFLYKKHDILTWKVRDFFYWQRNKIYNTIGSIDFNFKWHAHYNNSIFSILHYDIIQ
jgi:hypothetical protein